MSFKKASISVNFETDACTVIALPPEHSMMFAVSLTASALGND